MVTAAAILVIDMDGPHMYLTVDNRQSIGRNVAEKHGYDDILEVKFFAVLGKGTGNASEGQSMIASRTGPKISINSFRSSRTVFLHMEVEVDITAQEQVMGGNAPLKLSPDDVRRIGFIVQIDMPLSFHRAAEYAGRDIGDIKTPLFIVNLTFYVRKYQGRNIELIHRQNTVDDRFIQWPLDIGRDCGRVVNIETGTEGFRITVGQKQE